MAKQKKSVHRVQMTEGKRNIIHQAPGGMRYSINRGYPGSFEKLLGGTIKEMMEV